MSRIIEKMKSPDVIKTSIKVALILFLPSLVIAIIIAFSFGGTKIGPGEFSLFTNWISDLGSIRYTPAPFILDVIAMITAFLLIPIFLYIKKDFDEAQLRKGEVESKFVVISKYLAILFIFVADAGLFFIGFFSEDRTMPPIYFHEIFSAVCWGGFAVAALFMGLVVLNKDTLFDKKVGFFMIFAPLPATMTYVYLYFINSQLNFIFEWILLFCIFIWMIPFSLKIIKRLNS